MSTLVLWVLRWVMCILVNDGNDPALLGLVDLFSHGIFWSVFEVEIDECDYLGNK